MGRSWTIALITLAFGCGGGGGDGSGDDGSSAGSSLHDLQHGIVQLQLGASEDQAASPFDGTTRVVVELDYLECLIDFYAESPDFEADGVEGEDVFEHARTLALCGDEDPTFVDCEVEEIDQSLADEFSLTVTYAVTGPLDGRRLKFGPLPDADLAGCDAGADPIVRVGSSSAVQGFDGDGQLLWDIASFSPDTAGTDQGQAISIRSGRVD